MTGQPFVNVSDFSLIYDKKHKIPMMRFVVVYGLIPEGEAEPEEFFTTRLNGCLLSFGGGDEAHWQTPMHRAGWHYVTQVKLSDRTRRLITLALQKAGAIDTLKKKVDAWRKLHWDIQDPKQYKQELLDMPEARVVEGDE